MSLKICRPLVCKGLACVKQKMVGVSITLLSLVMVGCGGDSKQQEPDVGAAFNSQVIYRINAGGESLVGVDGFDWQRGDSYVNTGLTHAVNGDVDLNHPSIPLNTPVELFNTELWDQSDQPEMQWSFPVTPGDYEVRLYLPRPGSLPLVTG